MTAEELRAILCTEEFRTDLGEISSYLASIKQERPIVHLLAKHLWRRKRYIRLEHGHRDLMVEGTHVEFKFNFNWNVVTVEKSLRSYGDKPLDQMWSDVKAGKFSRSWNVLPQLYADLCLKEADLFVWVICARDLRGLSEAARECACEAASQSRWDKSRQFSDRSYITVADQLLEKFRAELQPTRPFAVVKEDVVTSGDFPSVYHFRLCEFAKLSIT